jgi:large subunit ribosomal protein L12
MAIAVTNGEEPRDQERTSWNKEVLEEHPGVHSFLLPIPNSRVALTPEGVDEAKEVTVEMEYIYAALLLHNAQKEITEDGVTGILKAAGIEADKGRVKALISALSGVNIKEAVAQAQPAYAPVAMAPAAAAAPAPAAAAAEAGKKEKKAKEPEKEEAEEEAKEQAGMEGLSALFG